MVEVSVNTKNKPHGKIWEYQAKDNSFNFLLYKFNYEKDTYYLFNVFVDEKKRGMGLGNTILDMAEDIVKKANGNKIRLEVKKDSFVHDWYKRHGYKDVELDVDAPSYIWMIKDLNQTSLKKNLFILFPGGFKPAHAGHILLAENAYKTMSQEYNSEIYFIVSPKNRDSITAHSTVEFLSKICKKAPYMHVIETEDCPSPVRYAYMMTLNKMMGDGCYCMLASTKDTDIKRARDFYKSFDINGKYYTEGVEPVLMESVSNPLEFTHRTDEFNNTPISASVLRTDIANNDFENFFSGYRLLVEMNWIKDIDVENYFNDLKDNTSVSIEESMAIQHLNEGGLGGHISHPYEIDDMNFEDISELINKLFCGDITDVTEKVDGMNLFASVDLTGEPIFARNIGHIREIPYKLKDLKNPELWQGGQLVANAFKKCADIIAKVFKNIPNAIKFFNTTDTEGNVIQRKWLDVEVIDPENTNIIPYDKVMVMFHMFKLAVQNIDGIYFEDYDDKNDLNYLNSIAEKMSNINAKSTPMVILEKNKRGGEDAMEYIADLNDLLSDYNLSEYDTILDYKKAALGKYIRTKFRNLDEETIDSLSARWAGQKGFTLYWFKSKLDKDTYDEIRNFEKDNLKQLQKKVIKPLETIFIKIGNKIISRTKNLINSGNEEKVIKKIKKQITDIIDITDKQGTESDKDKLEQLLVKLEQTGNIINASEGLVIRYGGRLLKITGSFAIINQMNIIKYKR